MPNVEAQRRSAAGGPNACEKGDRSNFSGKREGRWEGGDGVRDWLTTSEGRGGVGIDKVYDKDYDKVCDEGFAVGAIHGSFSGSHGTVGSGMGMQRMSWRT